VRARTISIHESFKKMKSADDQASSPIIIIGISQPCSATYISLGTNDMVRSIRFTMPCSPPWAIARLDSDDTGYEYSAACWGWDDPGPHLCGSRSHSMDNRLASSGNGHNTVSFLADRRAAVFGPQTVGDRTNRLARVLTPLRTAFLSPPGYVRSRPGRSQAECDLLYSDKNSITGP
jgi:hypothetical protein